MTSEDSPALRRHVANRAARRARDMKPPVKVRAVQPALPGVALERDLTIARFVDETAWRIGAIATAKKRAALAEIEVLEALEAEHESRRRGVYAPGDVVVLTAKYLWSAQAGLEAADVVREWTVQECRCALCQCGQHVCTTERVAANDGSWRHIAKTHIRHRGAWVDDTPVGLQPQLSMPRVPKVCR